MVEEEKEKGRETDLKRNDRAQRDEVAEEESRALVVLHARRLRQCGLHNTAGEARHVRLKEGRRGRRGASGGGSGVCERERVGGVAGERARKDRRETG